MSAPVTMMRLPGQSQWRRARSPRPARAEVAHVELPDGYPRRGRAAVARAVLRRLVRAGALSETYAGPVVQAFGLPYIRAVARVCVVHLRAGCPLCRRGNDS